MGNNIRIVSDIKIADAITHSGTFHADDVLATVILSLIYPNLVLARIPSFSSKIKTNAIVFDIGHGKFDHHQPGGNGFRKNGIPYASSGLIWKEFGHKIVSNDYVWNAVDEELIQGVDYSDNGIYIPNVPLNKSIPISRLVSLCNPVWNDIDIDSNTAFLQAVDLVRTILRKVIDSAESKMKAMAIVSDKISNTTNHFLVLEKFMPWQEAILTSQNSKAENILFVIFPSNRGGYNWQCVPTELSSFEPRKSVPLNWRGLHGSKLRDVTGIHTANFCHKDGFIGGAQTLEDTIKMVEMVLNN